GVFRKEQGVLPTVHVREIDARVGAYHAVVSFCDQDSVTPDYLLANNGTALAQREFHGAGVCSGLLCPLFATQGWPHLRELNKTSLGFRNDLVLDDENVARTQCEPLSSKRTHEHLAQVAAGQDLSREWHRNQSDRRCCCHCPTAVGRGRSRA